MPPDAPVDTLERLLGEGPPIATDDWSLGDEPLRFVLAAIDSGARTFVECGSGRSTILIARRLAELGEGSVHGLEHDPHWAGATRASLDAEGLERASVITAPLEPHPLAGETSGWYARTALAELPRSIDLLLIDGPPAGEPELHHSRHPALVELGERLRPGALIVLDDATRPGETDAMGLWSARFDLEFELKAQPGFATARWPL